jgi:hypothetical protein
MNAITRLLGAAAFGLALTACGSGTTASEPAAVPDSEHAAAESPTSSDAVEGTYGSDARLDMLYDRCGKGDLVACDDLFWEGPLGSEYEAFAVEHGAGLADGDVLEYVWSTMDAREQEELCWETEKLGLDAAYEAFAEGFGPGAPPEEEFAGFVDGHC